MLRLVLAWFWYISGTLFRVFLEPVFDQLALKMPGFFFWSFSSATISAFHTLLFRLPVALDAKARGDLLPSHVFYLMLGFFSHSILRLPVEQDPPFVGNRSLKPPRTQAVLSELLRGRSYSPAYVAGETSLASSFR